MENKRCSRGEELFNTLSHGTGILLGITAGYFLLEKALANPYPHWVAGCVLAYPVGMLASYISSIWYHGSRFGSHREPLRKFDHGAIYLYIADTYTPFTLLVSYHAGGWGWGTFASVWLSAIAGFILAFKKLKEHSNLETLRFAGMGFAILVALKPLMDCLSVIRASPAFWWFIGGGASYIMGAVSYSLQKPYTHAVLHLFCLGGSIGHIIAIWSILQQILFKFHARKFPVLENFLYQEGRKVFQKFLLEQEQLITLTVTSIADFNTKKRFDHEGTLCKSATVPAVVIP